MVAKAKHQYFISCYGNTLTMIGVYTIHVCHSYRTSASRLYKKIRYIWYMQSFHLYQKDDLTSVAMAKT